MDGWLQPPCTALENKMFININLTLLRLYLIAI